MEQISGKNEHIKPIGRTLWRDQEGILFFNWTCSGIDLWFRGTALLAEFFAMPGEEPEIDPLTGQARTRATWPWLAVVLDDNEVPALRFALEREISTQLIFHSEQEETHRIRIVKLTENGKGYAGLRGFWMDGALCPPPGRPHKKRIEFIGDSITCGFGNRTEDRNRLFFSSEENGWMSHGAITARLLDMEPTIISSSGICLADFVGWPHPYCMKGLYPYTDRMLEDKLGAREYTAWDFDGHGADYVVLNLGTNDANGIQQMGADGKQRHRADYAAFLRTLRQLHGADAHIICALGSMDYYLYSDIQEIVAQYQKETRDKAITCFRYPKMDVRDPVGACGHPHITTHQKMAQAMADYIAALERSI